MRKLIFLLILFPALCWGQVQFGKFNVKKGGVVKKPGSTTYYEPWGSVGTYYIGEVFFDTTGIKPAMDDEASNYWYARFYDELDWRPPMEVYLWDGAITGFLQGGCADSCEVRAKWLVGMLKRNPMGEVMDSDGKLVYQFPYKGE